MLTPADIRRALGEAAAEQVATQLHYIDAASITIDLDSIPTLTAERDEAKAERDTLRAELKTVRAELEQYRARTAHPDGIYEAIIAVPSGTYTELVYRIDGEWRRWPKARPIADATITDPRHIGDIPAR